MQRRDQLRQLEQRRDQDQRLEQRRDLDQPADLGQGQVLDEVVDQAQEQEQGDDIVERLRQRPEVVLPATLANRAQRNRQPRQLYQAEENLRDRRGVKGGRRASAKRD